METMIFLHVSKIEEGIFHKMLTMDLGIESSKKVMSIWMFLESYNCKKNYNQISTCVEFFLNPLY